MQIKLNGRLAAKSFWLSLLLHFLLLASTAIIFLHPVEQQKTPNLYVPSYVYTGSIAPVTAPPSRVSEQRTKKMTPLPITKFADIRTPDNTSHVTSASILASTRAVLQENRQNMLTREVSEEPIYLLGDESEFSDPLIKMVGKALSAHFSYPKLAGQLGIKGRALIGMTLHPDGRFTNIELIQSSNSHDLDAAALYAVNHASLVAGADRFISAPKHFTVGFIFK